MDIPKKALRDCIALSIGVGILVLFPEHFERVVSDVARAVDNDKINKVRKEHWLPTASVPILDAFQARLSHVASMLPRTIPPRLSLPRKFHRKPNIKTSATVAPTKKKHHQLTSSSHFAHDASRSIRHQAIHRDLPTQGRQV